MSFSAFRYSALIAICVGFATPAVAASNYVTGKELQKFCSSKFNTDYGYCVGFVTGVADIMLSHEVSGQKACHRTSIKSQQLVGIVMSYIKDYPEIRSHTARSVVAGALARSFPCAAVH